MLIFCMLIKTNILLFGVTKWDCVKYQLLIGLRRDSSRSVFHLVDISYVRFISFTEASRKCTIQGLIAR